MLLNAPISSQKRKILVDKYVSLIDSGVDASKILVIVQNSIQKNRFLKEVLALVKTDVMETPRISSFNSIIYNSINDNWGYLENSLVGKGVIIPNTTGLEITQFILNKLIKDVKFKGYNSKKSLLHQIFRRYALIVQNNLTDDDVKWRSIDVLTESFADDAKITIHRLLKETLKFRSLDYLRQGLIFNYIYKNSDYFKNIEYLIIDNADEITPHCFDFIKSLSPTLKDVLIACDEKGSSRCGYLAADKHIYSKLKSTFKLDEKRLEANSQLVNDAETLYSNVLNKKNDTLKNFEFLTHSKRTQMINLACDKVVELLNSDAKPSDITIITPVVDDLLKFLLQEKISNNIARLKFITGSEKSINNALFKAVLTVLKLTTPLKSELTEFDARSILTELVGVPLKYCKTILEGFTQSKNLLPFEFEYEIYNKNYSKLLDVLNAVTSPNLPLSKRILYIFNSLITLNNKNISELSRFNFALKQINDFESVFGESYVIKHSDEIITQIENSIISENPYGSIDLEADEIVISTPQKIIDNEIQSKYQIWLDVSSDEWVKNDTGPLYNAWVFQSDWEGEKFTVEDELNLSRMKNARFLRKLSLCAEKRIFAYSSLFDSLGVENFGGIEKFISSEKKLNPNVFSITPRDDQKPVLDYKQGKMAISAVPGAGKTTILLALIIKLLEDKINPENIFVLTYMESAARNFRERIKNVCSDLNTLPNISTIHGLALKILKENGNFTKLGLPADFEICDETKSYAIMNTISKQMHLSKDLLAEFERAISVFKMSGAKFNSETGEFDLIEGISDKKLLKFIDFYNNYQKSLKSENSIDYDDMLILSVKLLEDNEDVRTHYQNICEYIIEDEAQDSSVIQQRLIKILSAKHNNLIRCGDINQAITTTFSNADVEGFRTFIKESNSVEMNCSQRCSEGVYELANNLVRYAEADESLKGAFYNIFMNPVEGRNPVESNSLRPLMFKTREDEENYILREINRIFVDNPNATVGVLLRNNYQVADWLLILDKAGIKTISRTDCLCQKSVYKVISSILKFIDKPFDNKVVSATYQTLSELGYYKKTFKSIIDEMKTPFVEVVIDEVENVYISRFYWDMLYWLQFSSLAPSELVSKIGFAYFTNEIDNANIYLISTFVKRLESSSNSFSSLITKMDLLANKNNLRGFKFFSEADENDNIKTKGSVQIMTYHKSKGDEFDYVFMPMFTENNLPICAKTMTLRGDNVFTEKIRALNESYKIKSDDEIKKTTIDEDLRVLYVAITRAKRRLYITCPKAKLAGKFEKKKLIPVKESIIFKELLKNVEEVE